MDKKLDITIVCILYKCALIDSLAYNSIVDCAGKLTDKFNIKLVLYDNSPSAQDYSADVPVNVKIVYSWNGINEGLAKGYNFAYKIAKENGNEWMITMDQDTVLTFEYFEEMYNILFNNLSNDVVAIVPKIKTANDRIGSPSNYIDYNHHIMIENDFMGVMDNADAINSASVIRVSYLEEIGGYNLLFPIDSLDVWFFYTVRQSAKKVLIMNCSILQNFAFDNFATVSEFRKKSVRRSVVNYLKLYETPKIGWGYILRRIKRGIISATKDFSFARLSHIFKEVFLFIFTSKRKVKKQFMLFEEEKKKKFNI